MKDLEAQGYGLAAISYDSVPVLADFSHRRGITFPLLSDVGSATIKAYGILNPVSEEALGPNKDDPAVAVEVQTFVSVVRPTAAMVGIAFPGTFMLDRQGRVTSRFFEQSYIERNTVASILTKISGSDAPVAATKISTAHLEMMAYGSDPTIAAGNRFSLSVTVTRSCGRSSARRKATLFSARNAPTRHQGSRVGCARRDDQSRPRWNRMVLRRETLAKPRSSYRRCDSKHSERFIAAPCAAENH